MASAAQTIHPEIKLRDDEPYLLQFATPRSNEGQGMGGRYCEDRQVWVIDFNGAARPIVEYAPESLAQTQTKTFTQVEADDHDQDRGAFAGTSTFTKVRQEADDQDASFGAIGETRTLTEVRQEADDRDPSHSLLEVQTKTDVSQESDDHVPSVI